MPPGPNKRKSAKKKKRKAKPSKSSGSTPVHSPRDDQITTGESDGGEVSSSASNSQLNSPLPPVNSETREHNSSAKKSSTTERTDKASEEKQGTKTEIDKGSSSQKPQERDLIPRSSSSSDNNSRDKKKGAVIEPAPVNTKLQKKKDRIVNKSPLKQTVVHESPLKANQLKDTGLAELVEKLVSVDEKASPKSKDCLTASTLNCPFCGRGGADRVIEHHETPECPEKHPLLSPNPGAAEKASWKSCCGIFELCSGSSRN